MKDDDMLPSIVTITQTLREWIPLPDFGMDDETSFAYWLLLPALAMMFVIHFIPIVWGVIISFMRVDAEYITDWTQAPFIGVEHYLAIFDMNTAVGSSFWTALRQTFLFGIGTTIGVYVLGLVTALLLNRNFRGKLMARTVVLVPYIAPAVATVFIWRMMLSSETGIINEMLMTLGLINDEIFWLVGENSIYSIIIVNIWKNFPFAAIMLYAGLQSIPEQLYEAAAIDGASRWATFRHITFPQLKPVTAVIVLLMIVWSFINFTIPYLLLGQQPSPSGEVLMLFIYNYAFKNLTYGLGAALSVILLVVAMVLSYLYYKKTMESNVQGGAI
ncbi:carbohydrate ABC transporter permease [Halocatena salina]|uniref:Sugar ABC transporter permease n=1 Tax=Halocatena salina TaxID=2934340 RepID=A0A8U0A4U6_9EURY|nr:sugar ABC transporter permease [Halocatena salina]UPM42973.1 sugar ABC transporter permease [Halocatena salina]